MPPSDVLDLRVIAQICQELGDGFAARGHFQVGRDLGQRSEEELSLSQSWMGDLELGPIHLEPIEELQVDVEVARSETRSPCSPGSELEGLGHPQQLPRVQSRVGHHGRVQVPGLGDGGDGAGAKDRGDAQNVKL